jgi:outer membrane biosynthesis protein TonB
MQVPPPRVASSWLEQKVSDPVPCEKVQHLGAPVSVQSAGAWQRRTTWVPVHVAPSFVGHCAAGVHATTIGPVVQFGILPPVIGIVPQHTSPLVVHSSGSSQAKPASSPPEEPEDPEDPDEPEEPDDPDDPDEPEDPEDPEEPEEPDDPPEEPDEPDEPEELEAPDEPDDPEDEELPPPPGGGDALPLHAMRRATDATRARRRIMRGISGTR